MPHRPFPARRALRWKLFLILLFAILLFSSVSPAQIYVTYQYTGNPFEPAACQKDPGFTCALEM